MKIVPDEQRLAVLRAGRFRRLIGPGIVLLLMLPGTQYRRIAIGDRGQLMTMTQARFGDTPLSVELRGAPSAGTVRIVAFREGTIIVAPDDADAATTEGVSSSEQGSAPPAFQRRHFWIGLPVVVFFCALTWGGFLYAANQIRIERQLYERGVLTTGTVIEKTKRPHRQSSRITYSVAYAFRTPAEYSVRSEADIESALWHRLKEGGEIAIRYLPNDAAVNLPDGRHLGRMYYWAGGASLGGALLFSAILIGMLVKRFAGGYRGETHPFLGARSDAHRHDQ